VTRLAFALAALAALLAALAWVLARPRWRWDPEPRPCDALGCRKSLGHDGPHLSIDGTQWSWTLNDMPWSASYSTGSPPSVTSRAWNGTNWRDSDKPEFV
jgi:hypothetical protein